MIDFKALLAGGKCIECGTSIEHFGVCDSCADKFEATRIDDIRREAIATIPQSFRWATFGNEDIHRRVSGNCIAAGHRLLPVLRHAGVPFVVLYGPAGSGKTTLACAIMRQLLDDPPLLRTSVGLRSRFQCALALSIARCDSHLGSTPHEVDASLRASLLVLDDLGQEDASKRCALREVIHGRFNAGKPTIVTTWMNPATLPEVYGEGTSRRLTERAAVIELEMPRA